MSGTRRGARSAEDDLMRDFIAMKKMEEEFRSFARASRRARRGAAVAARADTASIVERLMPFVTRLKIERQNA